MQASEPVRDAVLGLHDASLASFAISKPQVIFPHPLIMAHEGFPRLTVLHILACQVMHHQRADSTGGILYLNSLSFGCY